MRARRRRADGRNEDVPTNGKTDRISRRRAARVAGAVALAALVLVALPGAGGAQPAANSAHEITFWTGADRVASLTDAQLDAFADMGVGGFVMQAKFLTDGWTDDPDANLNRAGKYAMQRQIRDSRIVQRAAARGIDLYLGFFAANATNDSTPYVDWFDDEGWARTAEKMGGLAGAARMLGFRGIAIDQELYGGKARWTWNYPGNTHTEAEVRAKAKQRGRQAMTAILDGFPGVEIGIYNFMQKDSWLEFVYEKTGTRPYPGAPSTDTFGPRVDIDFWDGMTSVEGYSAIRQWNSVFSKNWHLGTAPGSTLKWENAMRADVSNTAELLSKEFENWDYAAARYHSSPFAWINAGPLESSYDDARPPNYVQTQLTAMRKFGMGGGFANYHHGGGLIPRGTPRTPTPSGPRPRPGTSTRPRRRSMPEPLQGDPWNGPRQPRGLGRPLAGQPRGKRCRRAGLQDHRGGHALHQGLADGLERSPGGTHGRRQLGDGGRRRHQAQQIGARCGRAGRGCDPA